MKRIYLIRGLPGAGKSSLADEMAAVFRCEWFEADDYFYTPDGYVFDASKLYKAYSQCLSQTKAAMEEERNIIVSNTFTTEKELKPYLNLAAEHEYHVTTLIVEGRHGNPSVHGVPDETMIKMRNRFSVKL